jgi:hypothetical protein
MLEGTKRRYLTKKDLEKQLADQGIEAQSMTNWLQQLCREDNLPIEIQERKNSEGWIGKAKGMLQVLWE